MQVLDKIDNPFYYKPRYVCSCVYPKRKQNRFFRDRVKYENHCKDVHFQLYDAFRQIPVLTSTKQQLEDATDSLDEMIGSMEENGLLSNLTKRYKLLKDETNKYLDIVDSRLSNLEQMTSNNNI